MVMFTSRYVLCCLFTAAVVWAGGNKEWSRQDVPGALHNNPQGQYEEVLKELRETIGKKHQLSASPGGKSPQLSNGNRPSQRSGGKNGG